MELTIPALQSYWKHQQDGTYYCKLRCADRGWCWSSWFGEKLGLFLWTWELTVVSIWSSPLDHMPLSWPSPPRLPHHTMPDGRPSLQGSAFCQVTAR